MAEKKATETEQAFSKEQITASKKYYKRRDLLNALLEDDKQYTLKEVDNIIDKYDKGVR